MLVNIVVTIFRYAARFVSGILDYKVIIDSYVSPCWSIAPLLKIWQKRYSFIRRL